MTQRQTQRRFGLLQHHFSQQETTPVPAISPSSILPDNVTTQTDTEYTGPATLGTTRHKAIPTHLDLTTYQPISPMPDLLTDQPIHLIPDPLADRSLHLIPDPLADQSLHLIPDPLADQSLHLIPDPLADQPLPAELDQMLDQAMPMISDIEPDQGMSTAAHAKKPRILRIVAVVIVLAVPLALYLIWRPAPSASSSPVITQQNFSGTAPKGSSGKSGTTTDTTANSGGDIQAYIVGAVQHPGVYTLPADVRVYQLLQAAGGPSPNADLVALNLAAKLNDGQEVYVTAIGESPPSSVPSLSSSNSGSNSSSSSTTNSQGQQLVNINTATADEMRQKLSVSSKTAQTIVSYRQQHGPFSSIDQLSQVVSKSIYDKIKNKVTV